MFPDDIARLITIRIKSNAQLNRCYSHSSCFISMSMTSLLSIWANPCFKLPTVIWGLSHFKNSNKISVGLWTLLHLKFWYSFSGMPKDWAMCFQHLQWPYLYSWSKHLLRSSKSSKQSNRDLVSKSSKFCTKNNSC